jgi:hypothetical protein
MVDVGIAAPWCGQLKALCLNETRCGLAKTHQPNVDTLVTFLLS